MIGIWRFLTASAFWSLVSYIIEGLWVYFVPLGGAIYGGLTVLLLKIAGLIKAKFFR